MNARTTTVAVVDDFLSIRLFCREILTPRGYDIETYEDGRAFLRGYRPKPGCVLTGLVVPPGMMGGLEMLERMATLGWTVPVVAMSGNGDLYGGQACNLGALWFLDKPFRTEDLRELVGRAVALDARRRRSARESDSLFVERAASSDRTVHVSA